MPWSLGGRVVRLVLQQTRNILVKLHWVVFRGEFKQVTQLLLIVPQRRFGFTSDRCRRRTTGRAGVSRLVIPSSHVSSQTHAQSEEYTELSLSELSELSLVSDSASHGSALINMSSFKAACVLSVHCQSWGLVTMSNVKCQMQHYHHGWVYCSNSVDESSRQASARAHANKNVCD